MCSLSVRVTNPKSNLNIHVHILCSPTECAIASATLYYMTVCNTTVFVPSCASSIVMLSFCMFDNVYVHDLCVRNDSLGSIKVLS